MNIKKLKSIMYLINRYINILAWIARREKKMIFLYVFFDAIQLFGNLIFPVLLLFYFGYAPPVLEKIYILKEIGSKPLLSLTLCFLLVFGVALVMVLKNILIARITSNREEWYAELLRGDLKNITEKRSIPRISHYYGRLAGEVLQITGPSVVVLLGYVTILYIFSDLTLSIILWTSFFLPVIGFAILYIGQGLKKSIEGIILDAKEVALWKMDSAIRYTPVIRKYYSAYFRRIFLVSIFGYSNILFVLVFIAFLILNEIFSMIVLEMEIIIFIFIVGRIYLSALSNAISGIIKTAAFLPILETTFKSKEGIN
ncbi:hypothetical protein N9I25_01740 [Hellea sp.]|nr:hypothetical protein [Hellea sp.]